MKILILYYELAAYNIICFEQLKGFEEVHVVAYPVNEEAPFTFNVSDKIKIHNRKDFDLASLQSLFNELQPAITFCAGWSDKDYLTIASNAKNSITVLGFDNQWEGNLKQRIGCVLKRGQFQKIFDYAFVPGTKQKEFANKLGFPDSKVMLGAYSCDFNYFNKLGKSACENKGIDFPKRFLYVGRYIHRKGIFDMWNSFIELQNEQPNDWELWCIGTGDEFDNKIEHGKIKHFGFVQPENFLEYIEKTGVYILPSHVEPWGVSLHEFAAAGFPLLCSDKIGSSEKFIKQVKNGYVFSAGDKEAIKDAFRKVIDSSENELLDMQKKSIELSLLITPKKWANTLIKLLND